MDVRTIKVDEMVPRMVIEKEIGNLMETLAGLDPKAWQAADFISYELKHTHITVRGGNIVISAIE